MKRVVVLGDMHCGHRAGLCDPPWFAPEEDHVGRLQREIWGLYQGWVEQFHAPDVLMFLGDAIDGKGERSGGTEQITCDRLEQSRMAARLLRMWDAGKVCMVYGTPYHSGSEEDWERIVADEIGAEIHGQMFVTVNGVTFHCKHKVGSSSIPHGRHTATAREALWLDEWALEADWPDTDVILRGHVHYHQFGGRPGRLYMTVPALQAASTKYGSRQCSGLVHFGIVTFDVHDDGRYDWQAHTVTIRESQPALVTV